MTDHSAEYVAVEVAGKLAGISPRTLRHWIAVGKLSAIAGKRGKLVSVEEVHALAVLTGKASGNATNPDDNPATSAVGNAGNVAEGAQPQPGAMVAAPSASAQLAAIRDEWLQPLVETIAEQAERIGRLEAQRDVAEQTIAQLRQRAEMAESQLAKSRRRADMLEGDGDAARTELAALRASQASPAGTSEAGAADTATGAAGAPGLLQRLWRAIRGE